MQTQRRTLTIAPVMQAHHPLGPRRWSLRFSHQLAVTLAWLCLLAYGTAASAALPKLQALAHDGARVTGLVVDLSRGTVLAQLAPDERLTPASTTKLFTTAAALERWGPDATFTTRFTSNAEVKEGVLEGDLVFDGAGDPDFDTERLWMLITRLRQAGIKKVKGDVVVNDHLFGQVICLTTDRCKARSLSDSSYDAPLSSAGINFSTVELTIIPADEPDKPARLVLLPSALDSVTIKGTIDTVGADQRVFYSVRRVTDGGEQTLYVNGKVPAGGDPIRVNRSVAYPARYTASVLAHMLADNGITVTGKARVDSQPPPADNRILAAVDSPALARQLRGMMTYSNNYMADTLTLDLNAYNNLPAPLTLPLASQFLESYAQGVNAHTFPWNKHRKKSNTPLIIDSGSGLSITNRLSARDIVSLLAYMYRQDSMFPSFLGTLPVPVHTPMRSLKRGNLTWQNRVAAKTGTLSEPVSVRAIAGYFRLKSGGWGAFAFIVNGTPKHSSVPFSKSNNAIISDMEDILAHH